MTRRDLTGERFDRLVARSSYQQGRRTYWLCDCDCGGQHAVRRDLLVSHGIKSCGCLRQELTRQRTWRHGATVGRPSPEYISWRAMKARCLNRKHRFYDNYGGRGITICPAWRCSFEQFLADVGRRPTPEHSLDRCNPNGNYEPENCRWATRKEQAENRRPYERELTREEWAERGW